MSIPDSKTARLHSIRSKLTLMLILLSMFVLLAVSVTFFFMEMMAYRKLIKHHVIGMADVVAGHSAAALTFNDLEQAAKMLHGFQRDPDVLFAIIYDHDNQAFASYLRKDLQGAPLPASIFRQDDMFGHGSVRISRKVILDDETIGSVFILYSQRAYHRRLKQQASVLVVIFLLAACLIVALSFYLQRFISRPLLELIRTTDRISREHDYNVRVRKYGEDDLGVLADAFNRMLEEIQRHEKESRKQQALITHAGRLAALGEMATAIAHELGQPLQIMKTGSDIFKRRMAKGEFDQEELRDLSERIDRQVDRASSIIRKMRGFAHRRNLDDEPLNSQMPRIDLRETVEDVLDFFKRQFTLHNVRLQVDLARVMPQMRMDKQLYQQILVNLLSNAYYALNAVHAERRSDKTVSVRLYRDIMRRDSGMAYQGVAQEEGRPVAVLEVEDNGIGMEPDIHERCLDPFFTTKPMGEGTGLGLSILLTIVTSFQGAVGIRSKESQGSLFRVLIPYEE